MAITKPTDDILWAETPGDPGDVLDPSAKRTAGYQEGDPVYYNNLNYLLRSIGRAANFAKDALGAASDKLTLSGLNGYLQLDADPANVGAGAYHRLRHYATGTDVSSRLESDLLLAREGLVQLDPVNEHQGTQLALNNNVKAMASIGLQVNAGGTDWETPTLTNAVNVGSASINLSAGELTLTLLDTSGITITAGFVSFSGIRQSGGLPVLKLTPLTFHVEPGSSPKVRAQYDDAGTIKSFFTDFPTGKDANWTTNLHVILF